MMLSKLEKKALVILGAEIKKRWPLIYKTSKPCDGWLAHLPDHTAAYFKISEYYPWPHPHPTNPVLRVSDIHSGLSWCRAVKWPAPFDSSRRYRNAPELRPSQSLEVSFTYAEIETVLPWVLDNFLEVKTWPDFMYPIEKNQNSIGHSLKYCWSMKGLQQMDALTGFVKKLSLYKPNK
jgi:hypothetical protein